jgi:pimeloyl-ACP methyl ester carboxylesterase
MIDKNNMKYFNITLIFLFAIIAAIFLLPPPQNTNAACNPPDDDCDGGCSCENLILEAPSPFCEPATNVGNVVWVLKSEGSLSDTPLILEIICLGGGSPEYGDGLSWNIDGEFSFIISTNTYCEPGTAQYYVRITKPGKYRVKAWIPDTTCIKTQYIDAAWVDLDIDSDHTTDFGGPQLDDFEDEIEDNGPSPHEALKYVVVNDYYEVDDWVPGYANFEMAPPYGPTNTTIFVPVVLEFDPCGLEVPYEQVNVNFTYTQSDPEPVPESMTTEDGESVYPIPDGRLRLWTKNQQGPRNPASILDGGDFIPADEPIPMTEIGLPGEVTLYLEGINPTTGLGAEQIKVYITDSGLSGCTIEDVIHCTPIKVDIDIDSNNDDGFLPPEQNLAEDHYEDISTRSGKILCVNDDDDDEDGIPDFADGYNWDYHVLGTDFNTSDNTNILENFVPIIFEIPEPIDISTANIRISGDYEDSDPLTVTYDSQNGYELPESGSLRIWNCDDPTAERIPLGILDSGHIVTQGIYTAAEFGFTSSKRKIKCYVEAIQPSQTIADYRILFEVDPDGVVSGKPYPEFIAADAVRMTVIKVDLVPDYDRDGDVDEDDLARYSTNEVFRFWVNDDNDDPNSEDSGDDNPDGSNSDYGDNALDGSRDLIDFFPVAIQGLESTIEMSFLGYDYYLRHADGDLNILLYTGLKPDEAGSYLYSTDFFDWMSNIDLTHIDGEVCISDYFDSYTEGGKCVILVEGRGVTTSPLVFEIRKSSDNSVVYSTELKLELSSVEDMFYHKNLLSVFGVSGGAPNRSSAPNEIPANGKNFVFVHGYNVNAEDATGWQAEFFKRLYWSGSNARFHGITWYGSESQFQSVFWGLKTPNYHENVINALYTAPYLRTYINSLQGDVIIAGHSLGNMVVSSAIAQHNADVQKSFIINGAVAMECFNPSQDKEWNMVHSDWDDYYFGQTNDFLFASEWYTLFNNNDARHDLSWRGIFTNMNDTTIYNMYSSGENVLGNITHDKGNYAASASYIWGSQEKLKGRMFEATDWLIGSAACGWGININDYFEWYPGPGYNPTNLITKPFFLKSYPDLFSTSSATAQAYASANNKALLAKAIPARTFAVGRNAVGSTNIYKNVDMNTTTYQNGWPSSRGNNLNWRHSDIKNVSYLYNYEAYNYIVTEGNLQ